MDSDCNNYNYIKKFGYIVEDESITVEYKEFRPSSNVSIPFTSEECKEMITMSKWHTEKIKTFFDSLLNRYIEQYIARYVAGFVNTDILHGSFYIGISDNSEVIGFPLYMNKYSVIKKIHEMIDTLHVSDPCIIDEIKDKILIDVIHLDDIGIVDDVVDDIIINAEKKIDEYTKAESAYCDEKKLWLEKLIYYKRAINITINDINIRNELKEFIKKNKVECDDIIDDVNNLINRLDDANIITFENGQIMNEQYDRKSFAYWFIRFRDLIVNDILKDRPLYHMIQLPDCPYMSLLREMKLLIPRMIKANMPVCILKITIPGRRSLKSDSCVGYIEGNKIRYNYRTLDNKGKPMLMFHGGHYSS
jgi:hypothetical protein